MTKRILSILFTFWISIHISCYAQPLVSNKMRPVETFTNLNGLSHNNVHCIFEDSKDFLWLGTNTGLNRYDGNKFQVYKNDPQNPKTLSSNYIYGICEDQNQNIWVATEYGFNQITRDTYECNRYYLDTVDDISADKNLIQNIFCDNEGNIWVKSITSVSHLNLKTGEIKSYELETDIFRKDYKVYTSPIFQDSNGILWIGSENGLGYYEPLYDNFIFFKEDNKTKNSLSNNTVLSIHEDSHRNLWIGTENGLNLFNKKTKTFTSYFYSQETQSIINGITEGFVDGSISTNKLWLTTEHNGLLYFDMTSKKFFKFNAIKQQIGSLNNSNCITKCKDNILWIGTQNGLNKLDIKPKLFQVLKDEAEPIPNNYTTAVCSANDLIFIGTKFRGFHIYNLNNQTPKTYSANKGNFPTNYITSLVKLSEDEIIIGSDGYLSVFNIKNQSIQSIDKIYPELHTFCIAKKKIQCLLFDSHKNLWIGTSFGIIHFNTITRAISYYKKGVIPSNQILCLFEDHKGRVFVGSLNAICYYNYKYDSFKNIDISKQFTSRSRLYIYDMAEDFNGNIWVGTNVGLLKLDSQTLNCSILYKENYAFDEIYSLLTHKDKIWMGTNNGLIEFSTKTKISKIFSILDGVQDYEFYPHAAFKLPNDYMFFGGTQGVNFFHPDSIKTRSQKPNLELLELEYTFENTKHIIHLKNGQEITIPWNSSNLTTSFALLNYTQPHLNLYQYFHEPTKQWRDLGHQNYVTIIKPDIGMHSFKIRAANSEGVWSDPVAIKLAIPPPFWKTTLANVFKVLILICIILIVIYRIRRQIKRQHKQIMEHQMMMERLERQQEELEDKNKNILDSITYAKRIQMAIMPARAKFRHILPSSFLLYMPKDIVSGDFFWISEVDSKIFIGCADCTGHGVPGAFMSIIGNNLLRSITKSSHRASEILDYINKSLIELLSKNELENNSSVNDGMDISICIFDKNTCVLEFAGALTRMLIVHDHQLMTIRGDKFPVGLNNDRNDTYSNVVIRVLPNDRFYLFTDGYVDQFGGEKGKKLKFKKFKENILTCQHLPLIKQGNELKKQLQQWQGPWEQNDDILVMGFDFNVFLEEKRKRDTQRQAE